MLEKQFGRGNGRRKRGDWRETRRREKKQQELKSMRGHAKSRENRREERKNEETNRKSGLKSNSRDGKGE